jgi:hypothetical protein
MIYVIREKFCFAVGVDMVSAFTWCAVYKPAKGNAWGSALLIFVHALFEGYTVDPVEYVSPAGIPGV